MPPQPATRPKPAPAATLPAPVNTPTHAPDTPPQPLTLTPTQLLLARHALGLPNHRHVSWRNRFESPLNSPAYDDWRAMVNAGAALRIPYHSSITDFFYLTPAGARAALSPAERLDEEDFPPTS